LGWGTQPHTSPTQFPAASVQVKKSRTPCQIRGSGRVPSKATEWKARVCVMPTFSGHAREKGGQEQLTYTCWQVVKLCLLPGCRALVALSLLPSPAAVLLLLAPHFKCVCGPLKLCERFTFPFDRSIPSGFSFSQALTFQPSHNTKHRAPSSIGYARRLHTQHRKIRRRRRTPRR